MQFQKTHFLSAIFDTFYNHNPKIKNTFHTPNHTGTRPNPTVWGFCILSDTTVREDFIYKFFIGNKQICHLLSPPYALVLQWRK